MSRLHIFVDGSWLFKACAPERALANKLEYNDRAFRLDFQKLQDCLLHHIREKDPRCDEFGQRIFASSIFEIPDSVDNWAEEHDDVYPNDIENIRHSVSARQKFADSALESGFSDDALFRPRLRPWMLEKLRTRRYQEKQVDAAVVALLVRSAITNGNDYHAIITGDADILPAIKVAYPQYSENVFIATTHPDQLQAESRQTAFSLADFNYSIQPFYLEQNALWLLSGEHVYECGHCRRVFGRPNPIPDRALPCCHPCHLKRT